MADKMTCPGCDSYTSSILAAFTEGRPCPNCGLTAAAAFEVEAAQRRHADAQLTKKYQQAVIDLDSAQRQVRLLQAHLAQIQRAVREAPEEVTW